jgi:hypothetical protein
MHYLHLAPLYDGSPFAGNGGIGSRINRTRMGVKQRRDTPAPEAVVRLRL